MRKVIDKSCLPESGVLLVILMSLSEEIKAINFCPVSILQLELAKSST